MDFYKLSWYRHIRNILIIFSWSKICECVKFLWIIHFVIYTSFPSLQTFIASKTQTRSRTFQHCYLQVIQWVLRAISECVRSMSGMIVAVSPAPGWGSAWLMVTSRECFRDSPPLLLSPPLSLPSPPSSLSPPLSLPLSLSPSPLSEQECRIGSSHSVSHSVSQRRTFLHRAGVNNWSAPRLDTLMKRKWFAIGSRSHFFSFLGGI